MDNLVPIIVALLGSGLWTALFDYLKSRKNKTTTEQEMLLGLGHDRLFNLMSYYLSIGYITFDELENLNMIYNPYIKLGGNGVCEKMYNKIIRLPNNAKDRIKHGDQ